jgi:hypothetical protein
MLVERLQRETDEHLVDDGLMKKLRQVPQVADDRIPHPLHRVKARPAIVGEAKQAVAELGPAFDRSRQLRGAAVGADNHHLPQIPAVPAHVRERAPQHDAAQHQRQRRGDPEDGEEVPAGDDVDLECDRRHREDQAADGDALHDVANFGGPRREAPRLIEAVRPENDMAQAQERRRQDDIRDLQTERQNIAEEKARSMRVGDRPDRDGRDDRRYVEQLHGFEQHLPAM